MQPLAVSKANQKDWTLRATIAELPKEKEEKKETELEDTLPFDGKETKKIDGIGKDMYQSKYLSDEDKTKTTDINNKIWKNIKSKNKVSW